MYYIYAYIRLDGTNISKTRIERKFHYNQYT